MNTATTLQLKSDSLQSTEDLAAHLGKNLRGGEILALQSDLGGGKTAFARGVARGMGSADHVASPTFTLSREYQTPSGLTIYHYDFYRLDNPGILANELTEVLHDEQAVIVIEWGDIVEDVLPDERLNILIERTGETDRIITITIPHVLDYTTSGLQV